MNKALERDSRVLERLILTKKCIPYLNAHGKSSVFVNKRPILNNRPCMRRGTVDGAELARGTSYKHGSIE